jgi:predicted metal-dependent peptidase
MTDPLPRRLQASLLRIRGDHPFFGTLALFAQLSVSTDVASAATDGKTLFFNPDFIEKLDGPRLCGLVSHELLHAALQHVIRRRERDPLAWNIAADIVVNGMIRKDTDYPLPEGAVEEPKLAHLSVEEVYEQITRDASKLPKLGLKDVLIGAGALGLGGDSSLELAESASLQRHWRGALQQASAVARRVGKGIGRDGLDAVRDVQGACEARIGWRELLWQFIVATPFDFAGFDRRFIHQGLYLEDMVGESVDVAICIDTSGSIGGAELDAFYGEIQGILDAYPHIRGRLFFADADLYGPYEFSSTAPMPQARGGGGTDFIPFFNWVERHANSDPVALCIYFTDGYGSFPRATPSTPALWVVSPGGKESSGFPFGTVARMVDDALARTIP